MKKIVSVLLTASMVLAMTGCSKAEETTKKKKKTKKTTTTEETTEETTEDPSDDPSDVTSDATTTETDETSESETEPQDTRPPRDDLKTINLPGGLTVTDDLEFLPIGRDRIFYGYGAQNPDPDTWPQYVRTTGSITTLQVYDDTCPLYSFLTEYIGYLTDNVDSNFRDNKKNFLKDLESGNEARDYRYSYFIDLARADDAYLSIHVYHYDSERTLDDRNYANFYTTIRTEDQSILRYADVVKDFPRFKEYVKEHFDPYSGFDPSVADIRSEEHSEFLLLYDGIYVGGVGKVSVVGNEDLFDLSYFTHVPQYYTLDFDVENKLVWDLDGDGSADTVSLSTSSYERGDSESKLTITLNDQEYSYTENDLNGLDFVWGLSAVTPSIYVHSSSGDFLIVQLEAIDSTLLYTFKIENGQITACPDYTAGALLEYYDPDSILISEFFGVIGANYPEHTCHLDEEGTLCRNDIYLDVYEGPYTTITDLPATEFNMDTMEEGNETTIPQGSVVSLIRYYDDLGKAVMRIESETDMDSQNYVVVTFDKENWTIDGKAIYECFIGVTYGE